MGRRTSATPWCRRGVRHLGHGIDWAVTHAANSSWDLRSGPSANVGEALVPDAADLDGAAPAAVAEAGRDELPEVVEPAALRAVEVRVGPGR